MPVVEELSVGVRGLFQLLSISMLMIGFIQAVLKVCLISGRKNIKKCENKIDIKESKGAPNNNIYIIYIILYTHTHCLPGPAESLTAERLQSQATCGLPCIHFTAQALINYQTQTVTVTEAAVRLAPAPLSNKPKFIQC